MQRLPPRTTRTYTLFPYPTLFRSAINAARVDVGNLSAGLATTQVDIAKAKEDIAFAEVNFQRQAALMDKGFTTRAAYDASRHAVEQARASLAQEIGRAHV